MDSYSNAIEIRTINKWISVFFSMVMVLAVSLPIDVFAQTTVFTKGNVKIEQNSDGWQMLHGRDVIAHGDGAINVGNFAPLVQNIIDHYATKPVSLSKSLSK